MGIKPPKRAMTYKEFEKELERYNITMNNIMQISLWLQYKINDHELYDRIRI